MAKQSKLTKAARGKPCQVRLFPYCDGGGETTVFAHMNCDDKGMGFKSPDWWGADCCAKCHDIIDGRVCRNDTAGFNRAEINQAFTAGVYRTIKSRIEEGLILIK